MIIILSIIFVICYYFSYLVPTKLIPFLAKLNHKVLAALGFVRLWSDSTIALAWTPPNFLKKFVNKSVSEIQQLPKDFLQLHISPDCKSADLVSRGLDLRIFTERLLSWQEPHFSTLSVPSPEALKNSNYFNYKLFLN